MLRPVIALCLTSFALFAAAHASEPGVSIVHDFVERFSRAERVNAPQTAASTRETVGGVTMPGVFIHPGGSGDSIVRYPDVAVPGEGAFLLFHLGIRDGFDWDDARNPDGVRFAVSVDDTVVFSEDVADAGWRMRAVDLAPWAGQPVTIGLHTNARQNSNFDWAIFGRPALAVVRPGDLATLDQKRNGLVLARVMVEEEAAVLLRAGERGTQATLPAGEHWLPVPYDAPVSATIEVAAGKATLGEMRHAPFAPKIDVLRFEPSTPYIEAAKPFSVLVQVANNGWGAVPAESQLLFINFEAAESPGGPTQGALAVPRHVPALPPGERGWMQWEDIEVQAPGYAKLSLDDGQAIHFRVHPVAGAVPLPGEETPAAVETAEGCAVLTAARGRLLIDIRDDGHAWLEVRRGEAFERVGMLYPLARLALEGGSPYDAVDFTRIEAADNAIKLTSGTGVNLTLSVDEETGHFITNTVYAPVEDTAVRALYGPRVLAGQGAFGIHKDFAIFPGLEYLEGSEGSSTERDLAYPLSERQVPAHYKIATPLMAVQGRDALVALLWNPHEAWADGQVHPAARFQAHAPETGFQQVTMALFAPSVGDYAEENAYEAERPYPLAAGETMRVNYRLVLDHASHHEAASIVHGAHKGGLVLQAFRHYFEAYGFTEPSEPPRDWEATKQLSYEGYTHAIWQEDPPGWRHCYNWPAGLLVGHAVPQMLLQRDGASAEAASEIQRRIDAVLNRALEVHGPGHLGSRAGCHIVAGELPFYYGYLPEALGSMVASARKLLEQRENGVWVWRPQGEKYATLGTPGDHTLGQAAAPVFHLLRAARLSGDRDLAEAGLAAMQQMNRYNVPRGAQMWECPLYQPDILAAAYAIRAYGEAYRLTGDPAHLARARYWAWSGLPFLYLWELPGYPTMRYNVISVIGSTFHSHSWIGLPVVWCGLVYAYALQDFAQYDDSLDWQAIAMGITRSAEWQQYTEGENRGTYPDSWDMVENRPIPADISPENILMNGFRLYGPSPAIDFERFNTPEGAVMLNAAARISRVNGAPGEDSLAFRLVAPAGFPVHAVLAPVESPADVAGAGAQAESSAALHESPEGWLYDPALRAVVIKSAMEGGAATIRMGW